jgi:hypothetical protein
MDNWCPGRLGDTFRRAQYTRPEFSPACRVGNQDLKQHRYERTWQLPVLLSKQETVWILTEKAVHNFRELCAVRVSVQQNSQVKQLQALKLRNNCRLVRKGRWSNLITVIGVQQNGSAAAASGCMVTNWTECMSVLVSMGSYIRGDWSAPLIVSVRSRQHARG